MVVDAYEWAPKDEGQCLGSLEADHQGAGQARALGGGDGVETIGAGGCFAQSCPGDGKQVLEVLARSQFRDDAAVLLVQLDLGGDDVGQNTALVHHGGAGFIAGRFEGEQGHFIFVVEALKREALKR